MKKYMKPSVEINAVNLQLNINEGSITSTSGADGLNVGNDYEVEAVDSKGRDGWSDTGLW